MDQALQEANQRIQEALDHFKKDLTSIRAGRANPGLVEDIPVDAYGSKMKMVEVGTIAVPQPSLLTIQVWDASIVDKVIKSIQEANLGLNPSSEGNMIRLPIPPLTQERREEFTKLVHQKMEGVRIEIRQIRQEVREGWQKEQDSGEIGEDELFRREKILQELIDKKTEEVESLAKNKEEELMQV